MQKIFVYGKVKKPKVLVISTTLKKSEGDELYKSLKRQTYKNFLFCLTVGGTIAEGWNGGIRYAVENSIPIIVITETDCKWNSKYLLEFVLKNLKKKTLVTLTSECPALCAIHTEDCLMFDPIISRCEDTDWYNRLKKHQIKVIILFDSTPFHRTESTKAILKTMFWIGPLCNVYLVYSKSISIKYLIGRNIFHALRNLTPIFAIPFGLIYRILNKKKREYFLKNEKTISREEN